jgi:hypothetical protein
MKYKEAADTITNTRPPTSSKIPIQLNIFAKMSKPISSGLLFSTFLKKLEKELKKNTITIAPTRMNGPAILIMVLKYAFQFSLINLKVSLIIAPKSLSFLNST